MIHWIKEIIKITIPIKISLFNNAWKWTWFFPTNKSIAWPIKTGVSKVKTTETIDKSVNNLIKKR